MIETIPQATLTPKRVHERGETVMVINATIPAPRSAPDDNHTAAWAQLSVAPFARDWDSPEDAIYDDADLQ